jgi:pyruvate carboxylase
VRAAGTELLAASAVVSSAGIRPAFVVGAVLAGVDVVWVGVAAMAGGTKRRVADATRA